MPGFAGVLDVDNDKDYLFGNDVDMDDIIWMGPQPKVKELGAAVGISNTRPFAKLADMLREAIAQGRKIHFCLLTGTGICRCWKICSESIIRC